MASLSGILAADFSQFVSEGQKAEATIARMQGGAVKTEAALNRMVTTPIGPTNSLRSSFGQVDQVLNASGVNIGKYARGLVEISEMSGKTVKEVGGLATAASVFGAAMAGWNFGRAIAGFFDLDTKIGNATAKLLGWGDVAKETAGNAQDTINRAIAQGAEKTISYTAAIQFNIDKMKEKTDADKAGAEAVANAVRPQSDLMRAWNESAEAADGYTGAWTKLHEASTIYGDGLPEVTEKTKTLTEVLDEILAIQEPIQSGLTFTTETIGELGDEAEDTGKKLEALTLAQQGVALKGSVKKLTDRDVEKMTNTSDAGAQVDALERRRNELEKILASYGTRGGTAITSLADFNLMQSQNYQLSQINAYLDSHSFAGGVTNFSGGLARVHQDELLVNMPAGTDVIPRGGGRGGGNVYNINLSGMVGDRAGLARTLKQVLVNGERAAGKRLSPSGAVG